MKYLVLIFLICPVLDASRWFSRPAKPYKKHKIRHQEMDRYYLIYQPKSKAKKSLPVVLVFHGGGGNPKSTFEMTGMHELAEKKNFLAVYPAGVGKSIRGKEFLVWNAGLCCGKRKDTDDVGFVSALLKDLRARYNIDISRVYATGLSNGAQISYRLACELSDQITAIAPIGSQQVFESCQPKRSVPTIHFHGKLDQAALYEGGSCGGLWERTLKKMFPRLPIKDERRWECDSVPDSFSAWNDLQGLEGIQPKTYFKSGKTKCSGYNNQNILCVTDDAGHTWPGGNEGSICKKPNSRRCKIWRQQIGKISRDFSANEMMWDFFSEVPASAKGKQSKEIGGLCISKWENENLGIAINDQLLIIPVPA